MISWGHLQIPINNRLTHFVSVGTTRSGKSVCLQNSMKSVLPHLAKPGVLAGRAIVYDPKTTFLPALVGMKVPAENIRVMHPFDTRSSAWNMSADIETPTDATNIAAAIIPARRAGEPEFFQPAARDALASVMLSFHMICPKRWRLRDVLLTFREPERVASVLARTDLTRNVLENYGGDPRTLANITATIRKDLAPFEPIAACWEHVGDRWLSLADWVKTNFILLLGHSDVAKEQINIINRCLFQRLTDLLLSPAAPKRGRTWVFLDEAREIGRLPGLHSLLVRGAGDGHDVCVLLTLQAIQGLQEVYGDKVALEILGQCNNLAIFRLGNNRTTAEWAADTIGKAERLEFYQTYTNATNTSTSFSEQIHERYLILPEELQNMKPTDPESGLNGVFVSAEYGVVKAESAICGKKLFGQMLAPVDSKTPAFIPRPAYQHFLEDWTDDDLARLNFPQAPFVQQGPGSLELVGRIA
jgi:type IV secretory pathway TraG/TraD family ATPase VirD4